MTLRTVGLALAIAFAAFPARPTAQGGSAGSQAVVDLGTLGHDVSFAVAVNNKTQVIGWIADNFTPFRGAFLWEDGVMRELTAGPDLSLLDARDINDRGAIAGSGVDVSTGRLIALVWEDGQPARLPTPAGDLDCTAEAINAGGDVVGSCGTPDEAGVRFHAVLWRDGAVIDLAPLASAGESTAIAINDHGVVLGAFRTAEGLQAGSFLWKDGVLVRLDPALTTDDLNDKGQIAASRRSPGVGYEALILDDGVIVQLPAVPGSVNCIAAAINERADVAGGCAGFATIWVRGQVRTLPGLSDFFVGVSDLNDRGTVVGAAAVQDGNSHAVMWPGAAKQPPGHVDR